jgi:hypothetical protein
MAARPIGSFCQMRREERKHMQLVGDGHLQDDVDDIGQLGQ